MRKKVFLWAVIIVMIDQLVKLLIINTLKLNESIEIMKNFIYITYVQNEGAAWNIFYGNRWFLILFSFVAIFVVIKYFLLDSNITKSELIGYSLILGGITGNLIDRIVHGYIIDYIDTYIFEYNFPVFNIADSCIVIGVIIVIWTLYKGVRK